MVLFPTSDLSKAAAKALKKDLKVQLTADLAQHMNQDFEQTVAKYSDPSYLKKVVGRYFQKQSNQFLDQDASETEPSK